MCWEQYGGSGAFDICMPFHFPTLARLVKCWLCNRRLLLAVRSACTNESKNTSHEPLSGCSCRLPLLINWLGRTRKRRKPWNTMMVSTICSLPEHRILIGHCSSRKIYTILPNQTRHTQIAALGTQSCCAVPSWPCSIATAKV